MLRIIKIGLLLLPLSLPLAACTTAIGAATSGTQAIYDRHAIQNDLNNYGIANSIESQLRIDPAFKGSNIHVSSFHYEVLLVGTTTSTELQEKAAKIAAHYNNVNYVYNFITVGPAETGQNSIYDAWLTSKVKAKIIAQAKISPSDVKVITENRTVYLMGYVTLREAKIAINTARYTEGVEHVVTIFKYITYSTTPPSDSNG